VFCRSTQHATWQCGSISNNSMSNSSFNPSNLVPYLEPENVEPPRLSQRVSQPPPPATIEVDDYSSDLEDMFDALEIENDEIMNEEEEMQEQEDRQVNEDDIIQEELEVDDVDPDAVLGAADWQEIDIDQIARDADINGFIPPFNDNGCGPQVDENETKTVLDYFSLFITSDMLDTFVTNTNDYAFNTRRTNWINVTRAELMIFFAIVFALGIAKYPERRMVWSKNSFLSPSWFRQSMSLHRFEEILAMLHWEDTSTYTMAEKKEKSKRDCFWNIRGFLNSVNNSFQKYYRLHQHINIDEQGVHSKCRHIAIQYNKDKPYKWFFKVYSVNCSLSKFMWRFDVYKGKEGDRPDNLTATEYPVINLLSAEPTKNKNHVVYIDNWYNSVKLVIMCYKQFKAWMVGTFMTNRANIPKRAIFKNDRTRPRGELKTHMAPVSDRLNLFFTSWQDKRPVHMLSSINCSSQECHRRIKTRGSYTPTWIQRPTIIKLYNKYMGGTDGFDQWLSYYYPRVYTKRWPHKFIFHFFLASAINAHILYKLVKKPQRSEPNSTLLKFLLTLIDELHRRGKQGMDQYHNNDDQDMDLEEEEIVRENLRHRQYPTASQAMKQVTRTTGTHTPLKEPKLSTQGKDTRRNCRACGRKTTVICEQCNIPICIELRPEGHCWKRWHSHETF